MNSYYISYFIRKIRKKRQKEGKLKLSILNLFSEKCYSFILKFKYIFFIICIHKH